MESPEQHALLDKQHHAIVAPHYDELVNAPRKLINDCLFREVKSHLKYAGEGKRMLDLGAGTGQMSVRFGGKFSEVFLVDHSKEMLAQAKKNISVIESANFKLIETDALNFIEETEESFNFVACSGFLHHLDEADLTKAMNHIFRILKDKGHVLIAEPVKTERTEPALIRWWNKPVMPRLMQYLTLAPAPEETPLNLPFFWKSPRKLAWL